MGVKGLWSLLNPVARPVQIESLEGKRMAIDSSIWLYQFQSTMRDKDGRVLVNAHVLGFLRRINRLLFHGIKPVFVFDGGAPTLKRNTIAERKRKKLGAAQSHAKMAEKLLHAQMRREAVRLAEDAEKKRAARIAARAAGDMEESEQIPENAVYLEELEGTTRPSRPLPTAASSSTAVTQAPTTAEKKRFYKKDRYELPAADVPAFATDDRPDARLATEDELKQFIEDVAPEDIDVDSPEFRALPTEVQYEIIGDMRVRSRQQSHARLTAMLSNAPTALDFSKAQIKHLSQRNALTQQLLTVTDMVGKAHLTIPVRVAAERNREYVLVKRTEDEGGGWALGIREGTKDRPIELEPETENDKRLRAQDEAARLKREEDGESEYMSDDLPEEEVKPDADKELREHRRREVLEAITARYAPAPKRRASADEDARPTRGPAGAAPLFDIPEDVVPTANDEALALALQQEELGSDEEKADPHLARALAMSRLDGKKGAAQPVPASPSEDSDEFEEVTPATSTMASRRNTNPEPVVIDSSEDEDIEVVEAPKAVAPKAVPPTPKEVRAAAAPALRETVSSPARAPPDTTAAADNTPLRPTSPAASSSADSVQVVTPEPEVEDEDTVDEPSPSPHRPQTPPELPVTAQTEAVEAPAAASPHEAAPSPSPPAETAIPPILSPPRRGAPSPSPPPPPPIEDDSVDEDDFEEVSTEGPSGAATPFSDGSVTPADLESTLQDSLPGPSRLRENVDPEWDEDDEDEDEDAIEWSRSPTPERSRQLAAEASAATVASAAASDFASDGEMGAEDMVAEEDEYARFLAQIQNRDLADVRTEIDDEIRILHGQTKAAMRDSDEITQTMVSQIQTLLRHFGIPYITAPMEAEAQCAKLAELNLVDGIITDDSDVFLFGGTQCFKNVFNDAKFAECFVATDIERELSLTRERLISLAYLLGSDYTLGIMGVGPVMALELLSNFPGPDGLQHFKEWWTRVQQGVDLPIESDTKWKRSFKKRFEGSLHLGADWPNPHVREAYLHPTADASEEPFHWGFPRLAALRVYLHEELSWSISKVDDELTPIVQRIAQRGRGGVRQGTLLPFFDHSAAVGKSYAPRQRTTANVSKRLLAVIKEFREAEARVQGQQPTGWGEMLAGIDEQDPKGSGRRPSAQKGKNKEANGDDATDGGDEAQSQPKSQPKRKRGARTKTASASASASATASASAPVSETDDAPPPPPKRRRGRGGRCPAR